MQLAAQNRTVPLPVYPPEKSLSDVIADMAPDWNAYWGWRNYKPIIKSLAENLHLKRLCEIGGGRNPIFTPEEMREMGCTFTVNDISQSELDHGPGGYDKLCLDIASDIGDAKPEQFDLMFSQMVFEHVRDMKQAWRNVHTLLAPGGVALAFFPTLYALPFVINKLLPETVTGPIVRAIYPHRSNNGRAPKFPAYYDYCFGDGRILKPMLDEIGFREHHVLPFWGHDYFKSVPVVREIDNAFNKLAAKRHWSQFTSYAYVMVRK
jgi:SAM-dependent methyltransferase